MANFKATEFKETKPEYALNDNGELVATGKDINVQAQIQSQRSKCMDRILDKFIEQQVGIPQGNPVYGDGTKINADPKAEYAAALAYAEELRSKYNIPLEEYDEAHDKTVYVDAKEVLQNVGDDSKLINDIVDKNKAKSEQDLEYEAFLKWKEEQNK